jgi:heptosyltransferase II
MQSLIVRMPNHLGDVCMTLPSLDMLAASGYELTLVGRPWLRELFWAYPWAVFGLPKARGERIRALRDLKARGPGGTQALLFTNSFSTALDLRLVGWRAIGYATDARRWLLGQVVPVPRAWRADMHTRDYYYHLARVLVPDAPAQVPPPQLQVGAAAFHRARAALVDAGVRGPYVVLCPVAVGLHRGRVKRWDGFGRLALELSGEGHTVVICPGPGELPEAQAAVKNACFIGPLDLAAFAALLRESRLVVANDSGPAHLAAAVGARLVAMFGVTDPGKTSPAGDQVVLLGSERGWPHYEVASATVATLLSRA